MSARKIVRAVESPEAKPLPAELERELLERSAAVRELDRAGLLPSGEDVLERLRERRRRRHAG